MRGFLFRLVPPRTDFSTTLSDEERAVMADHLGYWSDLVERGHVVAFGPVDDPGGTYGLGIVVAEDLAAAQAVADGDPAVRSPYGFTTEITPMAALVTPEGRLDPA